MSLPLPPTLEVPPRPECGQNCLQFLGGDFPTHDVKNACGRSAERGHLECLRYAHEQGCRWDEWIAAYASGEGHLECLRYTHEQGCPWDEETCRWASMRGHLECLRYAHEHGCPWGEGTCTEASQNGHAESLLYTLENGCPVPDFREIWIHSSVVPLLHHQGFRLSEDNSADLRDHIRSHVQRARLLMRCIVVLLGEYRRACERIYAPGGEGYREAEDSWRRNLKF